jgi:hypothetical protein
MIVKIRFLNKEFVGEFDGYDIFTKVPIDNLSEFIDECDLNESPFYSTDFLHILEKYGFVTISKYEYAI